ncbi:SDR family NAD(P)-dependent oxidoreductase [Nocardioides sp. zg-536]|uniref:SDR family NAD(P)-dependent oxidoreductase n=1 Tax=Nocardioides faecalis TaxID=2803858 RepID=A0A938Y7W0_9ACTN|nr:SDR family NAD(P)-dependent oxidoreductase [Nocardioides faecalis]MBM9460822.1 SDR family NAD(P)-dependent oxidoreductase [Nocardioides faecalis]QVI58010.1 SDR family NAD(P)-dependent oxidoreductase [Nocardioides faecalis]
MKVNDRRVVVTGASSGIGAALARELAGRGARVVLVARTRSALEALAADLPHAEVVCGDLSTSEGCTRVADEVLAGGVPDVVVHNAGAGRWLAVDETPAGEAAAMMAVPYLAAFELTRALAPAMIARGSGQLAYMTSVSGFLHVPGSAGYSAARWAMRALAGQVRADLRGTGVGVTLLAPAEVDSPYFEHNPGTQERIPKAGILLGGRSSTPVVARLCADAIESGRRTAIVPRQAALVVRTTPPAVLTWLAGRTGWRRR